ncbi:MAG: hypothetical protein A2Y82_00600 [Candidatus Buchananbacteria bacterium RBG_13_36_9]|uniref:Cell envelope-related transcriptional attenuator domain-containing protein n=1 Tax=Candidatus Buchananbacteria bacterium RBG_13_36_9 TaxID=1797530 RepID=A0A1G1XNZ0_9BACT|nr:MAG: hypothetical protein A2Y82_00600 [Candidatus Buchananbacteria bacterium RBG_13_36_9]
MPPPQINFLNHLRDKKDKKRWIIIPKIFFYPLIFLLIFIFIFSFQVIISGNSIAENLEKINIFNHLGLNINNEKLLKGETEDRINILLLGMGGEGHPGPDLTDTMILASLQPSTKKVAMISIPRDLSVPIPGYGWRKINNANHFGEMKNAGEGAKLSSEIVSQTFNLPVQYYVRVDFSGFEKLIDELDGIKIYVDNAFTDPQFPTDDYGYQTVSFKQGWQKMDGKTALNYARSRHGTNGENSDFARSKRQQKVLQAIKDKALSFTTFISYRKISALFELYKDNVSTNLEPWEIFKFYKLSKEIDVKNITNLVLDDATDGPLYATNINGAFLLLPRDMSFTQLQNLVKNVFDPAAVNKKQEIIKLEIQNGTKIEGLAYRASLQLKADGYKITRISNAPKQDYANTLIYDLTKGQKNEALLNIKNKLNADLAKDDPEWLNTQDIQSDFIVILGQNQ